MTRLEFQPEYPAHELPLKQIPQSKGIYVWRRSDEVIYVGKATNLRTRLRTHLELKADLSRSSFRRNVAEYLGVASVKDCKIRPSVLPKHVVQLVNDWILGCQVQWAEVEQDLSDAELQVIEDLCPILNRKKTNR